MGEHISDIYPVSDVVWFSQFISRTFARSNMVPVTCPVPAPLNLDAIRRAVEVITRQHEALRTVPILTSNGFEQKVLRVWQPEVVVRDVEAISTSSLLYPIARKRPNLKDRADGVPPLQITVRRSADGTGSVTFMVDHILLDGWGARVLATEFLRNYQAEHFGRPVTEILPPLRQPKDRALFEASAEGQRRMSRDIAYWQRKLDGVPPSLPFPNHRCHDISGLLSRPRSVTRLGSKYYGGDAPRRTPSGASCAFTLAPVRFEKIRAIASRAHTTPTAVFLAAYWSLLACSLDEYDFATPVLSLNRGSRDLKVVGNYSKWLPLRARVSRFDRFEDVLQAAWSELNEGSLHGDFAIAGLSQSVYQAMYQKGLPTPVWGGYSLSYDSPFLPTIAASVDPFETGRGEPESVNGELLESFTLKLSAGPQGVRGEVATSVLIADADALAGFVDAYIAVLEAVCTTPNVRIAELPRAEFRGVDYGETTPRWLKSEGRRFDLAAIEAWLCQLPEVVECQAYPADVDASRIAANVVLSAPLDVDELRRRAFVVANYPCARFPEVLRLKQMSPDQKIPIEHADEKRSEELTAEVLRIVRGRYPSAQQESNTWDLGVCVKDVPAIMHDLEAEGIGEAATSRCALTLLAHFPLTVREIAEMLHACEA